MTESFIVDIRKKFCIYIVYILIWHPLWYTPALHSLEYDGSDCPEPNQDCYQQTSIVAEKVVISTNKRPIIHPSTHQMYIYSIGLFSTPNLALDAGYQGAFRVIEIIFLYKNRGENLLSSLIVWKYQIYMYWSLFKAKSSFRCRMLLGFQGSYIDFFIDEIRSLTFPQFYYSLYL